MSTDVTVKRLINGREGRGVNRYMLEEIYFSKAVELENGLNPQEARYSDGKWYFNFPDMWYNNLSTSKAIGLRKIDVFAKPFWCSVGLTPYKWKNGDTDVTRGKTVYWREHIGVNTTASDILSKLRAKFAVALPQQSEFSGTDAQWEFDWRSGEGNIEIVVPDTAKASAKYGFVLEFYTGDTRKFFNLETSKLGTLPTKDSDGTLKFDFHSIWNREFAFIHASFVTGTSFNYLGRSGEFYPAPSKMYPASHSSQQFYFEISFDGMHPAKFSDLIFIIDLAYIYYDKDYNGD